MEETTSCKETNQNNRPLLKRPENALAPSRPSLSESSPPPSSLCLKFFFLNSASICSHYLIPHVPTGVTWLEFSSHFILLQPVVKPDLNQLHCSNWLNSYPLFAAATKARQCAMKCLDFSLPNYPEPQFNFTTSLLPFQHLNNPKWAQGWVQDIGCTSKHRTSQSEWDFERGI